MTRPRHVLVHTVGSLGDLFPFLAIGRSLAAAGIHVTIATHAVHQPHIAAAGLRFHEVGSMPDLEEARLFERAFHPLLGPRFLVRQLIAADVAAGYDQLEPVAARADLILTSTLAFAGQIAAERLGLPWRSVVLSPMVFLSAHDLPPLPALPLPAFLRRAPRFGRAMRGLAGAAMAEWTAPVRRFRRSLGLPARAAGGDPVLGGQHAPDGVFALFPGAFGAPQPNWPPRTECLGFPRYSQPQALDPGLAAFLDEGAPPIVFTLGSAAVNVARGFFRHSLEAAMRLARRAVLVTGAGTNRAALPSVLPPGIHAVDYAPHSQLFRRAAVVVHQGGIGTCAEALRAARPMLVVPFGFDQPDNAARLVALGVARTIPARRYDIDRACHALVALLEDPAYASAAAYAATLAADDGAAAAADRIRGALG